MRYLVISECIDLRSDKRFEIGDEFLPEPTELQAAALLKAGCLEEIPEEAPALPVDALDGMNGAQLRETAKLEKVTIGIGVTLDGMRKLIRDNRADLAKLDRDVLIVVAAAEQIEISAEADNATLRNVISAARAARATA